MGACYDSRRLKATTEAEAKTELQAVQDRLRDEFGSDPYNGTISNCRFAGVVPQLFDSRDAADDYLTDRANKREVFLARYKDGEAIRWLAGGLAPE